MRFLFSFVILLVASVLPGQSLQRFEASTQKLGTTFRAIGYGENVELWNQVVEECWAYLDRVDEIFSDYRMDSEANKLSGLAGKDEWSPVSPEMYEVILKSLEYAEISNGTFDITVGPLSKLWRRAFRQMRFPDSIRLSQAKNLVNYQDVQVNSSTQQVKLSRKGMRLDFGGIAKGYAVDQLYKILQQSGFEMALVDGGGDIFAGKAPPNRKGWLVKIESSSEELLLEYQAVASSGSTFRFLDWEGKKYSHLIDPSTGLGIQRPEVVNVLARTCTEADVLASIISILGREQAGPLLLHFPNSQIR